MSLTVMLWRPLVCWGNPPTWPGFDGGVQVDGSGGEFADEIREVDPVDLGGPAVSKAGGFGL
jgi:hypothetical protein